MEGSWVYPPLAHCHESVHDEFVAELKEGFETGAARVRGAPDWPETQRPMLIETYPFKVALERVDEGWTRKEIETELNIRTSFGKFANPIRVIGNKTISEESDS